MALPDGGAGVGISSASGPKPLGRFSNDKLRIEDEPRANQAMVSFMKSIGLHNSAPPDIGLDCSREQLLGYLRAGHEGVKMMFGAFPFAREGEKPEQDVITRGFETIKGGDGQDMKLFIYKPKAAGVESTKTLPCIVYLHGGGMTIGPTDSIVHHYWCRDLALGGHSGAVIVMPDFRNAYDDVNHELRPFPAGLNDCIAALEWVASHKETLGLAKDAKVLVCGESGGGNLSIATALKLKDEGKHGVIDGVYSRCPYISGMYRLPREELVERFPSLVECDGYLLNKEGTAHIARAYCSKEEDYTNPLAWPTCATVEQLRGSVPHTILVDELDPLRDEGIDIARKLERAGVKTVCRLSLGTVHAAPFVMRIPLWTARLADVEDMHGFIKQL